VSVSSKLTLSANELAEDLDRHRALAWAIGPGGAMAMSPDVEWALRQPGICTLSAATIVAAYAAGLRAGNAETNGSGEHQ